MSYREVFGSSRPSKSVLLSFVILCCPLSGGQKTEPSREMIVGTWSDACPCKISCPCWRNHRSSVQLCVNFQVFRIQSGRFFGVDLAGSTFVLANLPLGPHRAPVADTLFVDVSDGARTSAAEESVRVLFGFAPRKVSHTSIQYRESRNAQRVVIPGLLSYKVSFGHRLAISSEVADNLYPWLSNPKQGIVESVIYSPQGEIPVKYSKTNAISAEFRIPVPQR